MQITDTVKFSVIISPVLQFIFKRCKSSTSLLKIVLQTDPFFRVPWGNNINTWWTEQKEFKWNYWVAIVYKRVAAVYEQNAHLTRSMSTIWRCIRWCIAQWCTDFEMSQLSDMLWSSHWQKQNIKWLSFNLEVQMKWHGRQLDGGWR